MIKTSFTNQARSFKGIIILAIFLSATLAFGQTSPDSLKITKYVYCELSASPKVFGSSLNITVDFGEKNGENERLITLDPKSWENKEFYSAVEALNYMAEIGWEVVTAYSNVYSTVNSGTSSNCTYLLRIIKEKR
jgi:hypothetical protein